MGERTRTKRATAAAVAIGAVALVAVSCGDEFEPGTQTGAGVGAQGGSAAHGGSGGDGGSAGSGVCEPDQEEDCYEGASGTEDVGICHGGSRTCGSDGSWGECVGQQLPEAEDCAAEGDEDCDGVPCSEHLWSKLHVGAGPEIHDVAVDSQGNVVVAGSFAASIAIDGGPTFSTNGGTDAFVASFDTSGSVRWAKHFGSTGDDEATALAIASDDDVWAVGAFGATLANVESCGSLAPHGDVDGFVMRLDGGSGGCEVRWQVAADAGATGEKRPLAVTLGPTGSVFAAGSYTGKWTAAASDAYGLAAFVRAWAPNGTPVGTPGNYDGDGAQEVTAIVVLPNDDIVFGGYLQTEMFLNGVTLDGVPAGYDNAFLVKRSLTDTTLEHHVFGATGNEGQRVTDLTVDDDQRITVVGHFSGNIAFDGTHQEAAAGTVDAFVAQYDDTLARSWHLTTGSANDTTQAMAVSVNDLDELALVGQFDGTVDFGGGALTAIGNQDTFIAKLDRDGAHRWSRSFGRSGVQLTAEGVAQGSDRIAMVGQADGDIDFGGGLLTHGGMGWDVYVAVFHP